MASTASYTCHSWTTPARPITTGAAVSDDMFNEIRGKLGKYGVRPSELAYIMDVNTYIKSLTISNFRTLDKLGPTPQF